MEVRSSRHLRTLVTRMANSGLSANEIAGALISMMARSKCSNQRPDTLMQDRYHQIDQILLRRTAGPYIRVIRATPVEPVISSPLLYLRPESCGGRTMSRAT